MTSEKIKIRVPEFDGKDFPIWKKRVTLALKTNNVFDCVCAASKSATAPATTSAAEPADKPAVNKQDHDDLVAQEIILGCLSRDIARKVAHCENAKEMWARLLETYENSSSLKIQGLLANYYAYTKPATEDMASHVANVEEMAIQLSDLGQPQSKDAIITKLLSSLPAEYNILKESWNSVHPDLKTKEELVARLLNAERNTMSRDKVENEALLIRQRPREQIQEERRNTITELKKRTKCNNCGVIGHWARECQAPKTIRSAYSEMNRGRGGYRGIHPSYNSDDIALAASQSTNIARNNESALTACRSIEDSNINDVALVACPVWGIRIPQT